MDVAPTPLVSLFDSKAATQDHIAATELTPLPSSEHASADQVTQDASILSDVGLSEEEQATAFPEGGLQAWLCVIGAFFLLLPSYGMMNSMGAFLNYWETNQLAAYTASEVGWIPSVYVYLSFVLSTWFGPLFDRYGPRVIGLTGSTFLVIMFFLLAECKKYWQFMLCFGVLGGCSTATLSTIALGSVSHWFRRRRGLATGLGMIGSSLGGVVIPLLLRATFPRYGWPWSMRILGFTILGCLVIGNLLIKGRVRPDPNAQKRAMISLSIFGDMRFTFLIIAIFMFEIVLSGVFGLLPTYASMAGYTPTTGFSILAVMNAVSCLGRFIPGFAADLLGRFNVLLIMLLAGLVCMLALWLPLGSTSLPVLYVFSALFGFSIGSWMSLTPVCIGQLCDAAEFGRYYGTCYLAVSLATLICIPIGGELVQAVGPHAMVGFFCAVLAMSVAAMTLARWACLDWRWNWTAKI